jgi:hypothetical protein
MRALLTRFALAPSLLALACATAMNEEGVGAPLDSDDGGTSSGGLLSIGGSGGSSAGKASAGSSTTSSGGKAGSPSGAFGGSASNGGTPSAGSGGNGSAGRGGGTSGGSPGGSSTGGKGGSAGSSNGGNNAAGTGGSGTAGGPGSTVCDGVPDWTSKTYAIGDTVASTCSGVFAASCAPGQSHKFECNPAAGVPALPWCMSREPGVGNGWQEAWVDKGQCQ